MSASAQSWTLDTEHWSPGASAVRSTGGSEWMTKHTLPLHTYPGWLTLMAEMSELKSPTGTSNPTHPKWNFSVSPPNSLPSYSNPCAGTRTTSLQPSSAPSYPAHLRNYQVLVPPHPKDSIAHPWVSNLNRAWSCPPLLTPGTHPPHLCLVTQLCPTPCDPMAHSPPGSSVHGTLQARILEWVAMPSSCRGSSQPRDWTQVSSTAGRFFTFEPPGKPPSSTLLLIFPSCKCNRISCLKP